MSSIPSLLREYAQLCLVDVGQLPPLLHAEFEDGRPPIIVRPVLERRHQLIGTLWEKGAVRIYLCYDGYVTALSNNPHEACRGEGCDDCRGTGKAPIHGRRDAIVVITFPEQGAQPEMSYQTYRKIEDGSYIFDPVQTSAGGQLAHEYPTGDAP